MAQVILTQPAGYTGSKAQVGRQSIIAIGGITGAVGGTATFVPIEELVDASPNGGAWGTEENTNFQSGVDEEFLTTTRNNGMFDLKGNLLSGAAPGQAALIAAYNDGLKRDFIVQLPKAGGQTTVGNQFAFSALVTSFYDFPITTKGVIQFTSKLKVSGPITPTAGS